MEQEKHSKKTKSGEEDHEVALAKAKQLEDTKKELENKEKELGETKKQLEEMKDILLRTAADFDNAKKRLAKEKTEFLHFANEKIIRGLLPILDNFERAFQHADSSKEDHAASLKNGIALIKKQFANFLAGHGLVRMEVIGKKFDPHFHEAIGRIESNDHPDETVLEEIESGYLLGGKLLRPARVRISHVQETKEIP